MIFHPNQKIFSPNLRGLRRSIINNAAVVQPVINDDQITRLLEPGKTLNRTRFEEILSKAKSLKGLSLEETAFLLTMEDAEDIERLTEVAISIKEEIYGRRLVLFAPLYTSNLCSNNCLYCGFRSNVASARKKLSREEIIGEVETLIKMGHKRILMVAGEEKSLTPEEIRDQILAIYSVKLPKGNIRRVNVNVAPMDVDGFKIIKTAGLGTYQCFQETYHRPTYEKMHIKGRKRDYDYRLHVFDRCIEAGIDDFGAGFLFGLYDYRYEILALFQHIAYLENRFGIGPHTISIPRLEPAEGSEIFSSTKWKVSDTDLIKATAILRLAVPYTGIILSTRESPENRRKLLKVGVSQMSAGSVTNPGGYREKAEALPQFHVQDHRSLDEIIREACKSKFIPSFCTGCYRKGRTGEVFQSMAMDHHITPFCTINALTTLQEYLDDFASAETREAGEKCIREFLAKLADPAMKEKIETQLRKIKTGDRDILS